MDHESPRDPGPERFRDDSKRFWARMRSRSEMYAAIRAYFERQGVLEVETPIALEAPGTDVHLDPFEVRGPSVSRFLHTSPELAMKRLLVAGSGSIYQIAKVFRREERSDLHNPEFTMLEWYRVGWSVEALMEEVCALTAALLGAKREYRGRLLDFTDVPRVPMRDLFLKATGVDLATRPDRERLLEACEGGSPEDAWEDLFFRLMVEKVDAEIERHGVVLVTGFPAQVAALAALDPRDEAFSQRFELYIAGIEVANGYAELSDPEEQERRFRADLAERARTGLRSLPWPQGFLASLRMGLPDCAGVSIGLDRVLMIKEDVPRLADVLAFPWIDPA